MEIEKDPREVELSEINTRLKSVMSLLKGGHTVPALDEDISCAEEGLGDSSDVFIFHDSGSFRGTRHLQSLLQLESALETKVLFQGRKNMQKECVRLLERKVVLLRELHKV
jgi:hypothetical protein